MLPRDLVKLVDLTISFFFIVTFKASYFPITDSTKCPTPLYLLFCFTYYPKPKVQYVNRGWWKINHQNLILNTHLMCIYGSFKLKIWVLLLTWSCVWCSQQSGKSKFNHGEHEVWCEMRVFLWVKCTTYGGDPVFVLVESTILNNKMVDTHYKTNYDDTINYKI